MFITLHTKNFGETLVNTQKILFVSQAIDGSSILHFDEGNVLPLTQTFREVYNKIFVVPTIPAPTIPNVKTLIVESKNEEQKDKVYPDEFPDDFPRFKNGKICTTSKKYLEFMKNKGV